MQRTWAVVVGLAVVVVIASAVVTRCGAIAAGADARAAARDVRRARPDGVRVRVQVLNGTKVRGLARRATMLLRDRGFDVVEMRTLT